MTRRERENIFPEANSELDWKFGATVHRGPPTTGFTVGGARLFVLIVRVSREFVIKTINEKR